MSKLISKKAELIKITSNLKKRKRKIVLVHGVFDLIHMGHLEYFSQAKKYGDILIVSVTPDKFIQKGFGRPYFKSEQRMESLASIEVIDFVILNKSANATDIINKIKPNYYVKGPDYKNFKDDITGQIKKERLAVKKNGGKLVFTEDHTYSSSSILNQFGDTYNLFQKKIHS